MPRSKKGGGRGKVVKNIWDIADLQAATLGSSGSSGMRERWPIATTAAAYRRPRPVRHVDPVVLKRAFMLQNFQFILRAELLTIASTQGLPQGQRRLMECIQLSDSLVPWEVVHSVVMRASPEEFQCPICMEMPTAPRITECGHVYCLPCILQYMSRQKAAGAPRECPMCHELLAPYTLRPCVLLPVQPLKVGVQARFDLFKRHRDSCVLRRSDDPFLSAPPPRPSAKAAAIYLPAYMEPMSCQSRYVMTTPQYEAGQRYADCAGISERMRELEQMTQPLSESDAEVERFLLEALNEVTKEPKGLPPSMLRNSPPIAPRPVPAPEGEDDYIELYADGEGQPYYLHMLTVKMLKHDAKLRHAALPDTVTGVIEEVVTMEQTEETRRIYKVFSHVPLHGMIKLCVVNVDELVLPETRAAFAAALKKMASDRAQRQHRDDRAASEDASWKQYLLRYSNRSGDWLGFSPDTAPSDFSIDTESLPYLKLPSTGSAGSDHGLPPNTLDTRQRATKRQDMQPLLDPTREPPSRGNTAVAAFTTPTANAPSAITAGCWAQGSATKLFAKSERKEGTTSTWGGHVFRPK
ncbi:hypothetical protein, conserved [Leishmania tarentolae]|uniref:RING-type domain-containing protein n=1 Tax=Leishmania tarentolae TaxID=5689 RepID=A0A640K9D9_LEITA|nr:hypothetical protein, conserved [Leishmania tarentolae]GET86236.1 hypothetical protein, conserved [Leishmania tarentolae]